MYFKIFLGFALATMTLSNVYSASAVAFPDSQLTPEVTTEIATVIADKNAGPISKITLGGKEWNIFKLDDPSMHGDDLNSDLRTKISIDLTRIKHDSSLGDGSYTFLMRQPIPNREVFRLISFDVSGSRVDFKSQLGLIEFVSTGHNAVEGHVHAVHNTPPSQSVSELTSPSTSSSFSQHLQDLFGKEPAHPNKEAHPEQKPPEKLNVDSPIHSE